MVLWQFSRMGRQVREKYNFCCLIYMHHSYCLCSLKPTQTEFQKNTTIFILTQDRSGKMHGVDRLLPLQQQQQFKHPVINSISGPFSSTRICGVRKTTNGQKTNFFTYLQQIKEQNSKKKCGFWLGNLSERVVTRPVSEINFASHVISLTKKCLLSSKHLTWPSSSSSSPPGVLWTRRTKS
jgi:hypothetical protein